MGALRGALILTDLEKGHLIMGLVVWVEFARGRVKVGKIQIPTEYKRYGMKMQVIYQNMMGEDHMVIMIP